MRAILAGLLLITACEPPGCDHPLEITIVGVPDEPVHDSYNPCGWTGTIEWVPAQFMCGEREAWGCYERTCPEKITVAHRSGALRHELAHACGLIADD